MVASALWEEGCIWSEEEAGFSLLGTWRGVSWSCIFMVGSLFLLGSGLSWSGLGEIEGDWEVTCTSTELLPRPYSSTFT